MHNCDDQLCPFISFSAVQIYDISYIHLHSSSTDILRTHNATRALHRYRRGHGFKFRSGLNISLGFDFTTALSCVHNCNDQLCLHIFLRSSNIWYFIYSFAQYGVSRRVLKFKPYNLFFTASNPKKKKLPSWFFVLHILKKLQLWLDESLNPREMYKLRGILQTDSFCSS